MSIHADRYLAHLNGDDNDDPGEYDMGPEIVTVWEPEADLTHILAAATGMDQIKELSRKLDAGTCRGWGFDELGQPVYDGRKCCAVLVDSLVCNIAQHPIPSEHTCPECKSRYRIQYPTLLMEPEE